MADKDLLEEADEHFEQEKELQQEAVAELGQAEGLGNTETVSFGDKQLTVKAWLPGSISNTFAELTEAYEQGNTSAMMQNMSELPGVLAELCVEEPYDTDEFWQAYYDEWGPEGVITAFEKLSKPAMDGMENRMQVENQEEKLNALGNSQKRTEERQFQGH